MRLDGAEGVSPAERPGFSFSGGLDLRQGKIAAADDEIVWKAQDGEALGAEIGIAFAIVNALFLSIGGGPSSSMIRRRLMQRKSATYRPTGT
jgi:hypothetical protein